MSKQTYTIIKYVLGGLCLLGTQLFPEHQEALMATGLGLIGWGTPRLGSAPEAAK